MLKLACALLALSLSACAVIDISILDTALPVAPQEYQIAVFQALGLDLKSVVYDEYSSDEPGASADIVSGIKTNISLNPELDLQARAYSASNSWGGKIGLKKLMYQEGRNYLALAPAFSYVQEMNNENDFDVQVFGAEMQILFSQKWGNQSGTIAIRGNYNKYLEEIRHDEELPDIRPDEEGPYWVENKEYDVLHAGIRANLCLKYKFLYFIPEIGVEGIPVKNGVFTVLPSFGYALGIEF
ncbi:MAG: hypothetical protein M0R69_03395 [Candidatus Cloacimonetes bacterium]|jgi:hypothetical protein|nr:hypothetical protein [Candidatus Cloacimonadota bacterium]